MSRKPANSVWHNDSAQVLAEAAIGLALMVFLWSLITLVLFMANNRIRTTMAARHAAWYAGHGGEGDLNVKIDAEFFYASGFVSVERVSAIESTRNATLAVGWPTRPVLSDIVDRLAGSPHRMRVRFGVSGVQDPKADRFPFSLMKARVPLMPASTLNNWLSVSSECQWVSGSKTWSTEEFTSWLRGSLEAIFPGVGGELSDALVNPLFNLLEP